MDKKSDWLVEYVSALDSSGEEHLELEINKALRAQNSKGTVFWLLWKLDSRLKTLQSRVESWLSADSEKRTIVADGAKYFHRYM